MRGTDAEAATLCVAQAIMGIPSDRGFLAGFPSRYWRIRTRIRSMRFTYILALATSLFLATHISRGIAHDYNPPVTKINREYAQARQGSVSDPYRVGIHPIGPRATLVAVKSILGQTRLIAFVSTDGLCVEVEHISPKSRAGACSFKPLPKRRQLFAASVGFSAGLGQNGVTELVGMAGPTVQSVQVSYTSDAGQRHLSVPVGELPRSMMRRADVPANRWFAMDLPGCLESHDMHMLAFGPRHALLGSAKGLNQHAACQAGLGYKTKGEVLYGSLPPS